MAIKVTQHYGKGGTLRLQASGATYTERYLVEGLTGSVSGKYIRASTATGIPRGGDAGPFLTVATAVTVTMRDTDKAEVVVDYGVPDSSNTQPGTNTQPTLEVGASIQNVQTNFDVTGKPLRLAQGFNTADPNDITTYNATADVGVPNTIFRFSRLEDTSPGDNAITYVGKVNTGAVPWVTTGVESRSWRCNSISGRAESIDGPWEVSYEFQYAPPQTITTDETGAFPLTIPGWDAYLVMEKDGKVPDNLIHGKGKKEFQVYESIDFSPLIFLT